MSYSATTRRRVAAELFLPLSFFDISWLQLNPIRRLVFYNHPCSEAEFHNTIVPNLKHSLSITLKHYLSIAANLLYPLHTDTSKPIFRYTSGDSVLLTIAVSGLDFDELVADHARESDPFYALAPLAPPLLDEENYKIVPLVALQATLFPGLGICIGMNYHHSLCDGRSIFGFFAKCGGCGGGDEDEVFYYPADGRGRRNALFDPPVPANYFEN